MNSGSANPSPGPTAHRNGDLGDVIIAAAVAALMLAGLIWFALSYLEGDEAPTFILVGIACGAAGWVSGIALSPYDVPEQTAFSRVSNAAYAFASGYVLSKLDPLIASAIDNSAKQAVDPVLIRLMLFGAASFLIAIALTYITRAYWETKIDTPR